MVNALTIDVEDYWSIFSRDWLGLDQEPSDAVVKNTEWFLETLDLFSVKATFFVLGRVAIRFPGLVRKIARAGHEIGSHGISHEQIFKFTKEQFRSEITDSKKLLEDIVSGLVFGYRAPAFSIMPQTKWALEVLAEAGFNYDSSVFPISGRRYGWPGFSRDIARIELPSGRTIVEVPMSTVSILGKILPVAGGGYIRHFPYFITKWAMEHIQKRNRPVIVYVHPYEVDTGVRTFDTKQLSYKKRIRAMKFHKMQLRNRNTVRGKLTKLLSEFEFATVKQVIEKTVVRSYKEAIKDEVRDRWYTEIF